ncbi:MAG: tight adherence protein C [Myxococcota bacterium]|jgi:tight adherence protein C
MENAILIIAGAAAFMAVIGGLYGVQLLLNPERTARDRISDLTGGREHTDALLASQPIQRVTSGMASLAVADNEEEQNLIRTWLTQAGFRSRTNLEAYSAARAGLALVLPLLMFLILPEMKAVYTIFFSILSATAGYYMPSIYVGQRLKARQAALLKPFPDALDLLVSSVEAGLGVDAAFQRVAKEIAPAAPELSVELQQVNHEVAGGIPRVQALRRLDRRTGLAEVNSLVNVLTQAERFGTSIAHALRIHSDMVRTKRMLAAEEQAAQISPKLTVAMILFILPSLFIVLIGPASINVYRNLIPAMEGAR